MNTLIKNSWNRQCEAVQPFRGKGPHPLLWADSQAARGNITISRITNRVNYCVIFIAHTLFINVAAGWTPILCLTSCTSRAQN